MRSVISSGNGIVTEIEIPEYDKGEVFLNTKVMFSSETDLWSTPQDFFDELNAEFHFTLDPCATPENAKCAKYFTAEAVQRLNEGEEGYQ